MERTVRGGDDGTVLLPRMPFEPPEPDIVDGTREQREGGLETGEVGIGPAPLQTYLPAPEPVDTIRGHDPVPGVGRLLDLMLHRERRPDVVARAQPGPAGVDPGWEPTLLHRHLGRRPGDRRQQLEPLGGPQVGQRSGRTVAAQQGADPVIDVGQEAGRAVQQTMRFERRGRRNDLRRSEAAFAADQVVDPEPSEERRGGRADRPGRHPQVIHVVATEDAVGVADAAPLVGVEQDLGVPETSAREHDDAPGDGDGPRVIAVDLEHVDAVAASADVADRSVEVDGQITALLHLVVDVAREEVGVREPLHRRGEPLGERHRRSPLVVPLLGLVAPAGQSEVRVGPQVVAPELVPRDGPTTVGDPRPLLEIDR
jgi:hypothetical protein